MGEVARHRVRQEFDVRVVVGQWQSLYHRLLNRKRGMTGC